VEVLQLIGDFFGALLAAANRAMRLDPTALTTGTRFGWWVPVAVALISGVSITLGHGVVLAINRVRGFRRMLTMLASGIGTVLTGTLEALMIALAGHVVTGASLNVMDLLTPVLLSSAPYWLGFLVAVPYSGPGIARGLNVWHLVCLWALLIPVLDVGRTIALTVAAAGWLATTALGWLVEHSPLRLRERVFRLVSGTKGLTSEDVLASSTMEARR